jgi:hypothetical protein
MPEPVRNSGFGSANRKHHDVFISYAQMDKPIADAICAKLESRKIRCWIAPRDVPPAREFPAAIIEGIEGSQFLVLVFSSHANNSPHVLRELTNAVNKGRIIVPFRVEDVMPSKSMEYLISVPHWLDAITPPLEKHIDDLADSIENILASKREGRLCPGCGAPLSAQAKFCTSCGAETAAATTDAATATSEPAAPIESHSPADGFVTPKAPVVYRPPGPLANRNLVIGGAAVVAVLVLAVFVLPMILPAFKSPLPGTGNGQPDQQEQAQLTPVDYRSGDAPVNTVKLTTEPTQALPKGLDLLIEASKDATNAMVTVQFAGGPGLGRVQENRVILTRSDGTVEKGSLNFNQRLSEVSFQGTRGTDRLQVIVTMSNGVTYTIIDRLMPYRIRSST